jgi:hypothetical protein
VIEKTSESVKKDRYILSTPEHILGRVVDEIEANTNHAVQFLSTLELEFSDFVPAVRTKRATIELLKYKYNAFKKNAKLGALPSDDYSSELSRIVRRLNGLEGMSVQTTDESLSYFIGHSVIFEPLTEEQKGQLPYLLT